MPLGQDWECPGGGVGSLRAPQTARLCGTAGEKRVSQLHGSEATGITSRWNGRIGTQEVTFSFGPGHGPFSPQVGFCFQKPCPSLDSMPLLRMQSGVFSGTRISPLLAACLPQLFTSKQLPPARPSALGTEKGRCVPSPAWLPFLARERLCSRNHFTSRCALWVKEATKMPL